MKNQQHTKIDYLTVTFTLPFLRDVAENCAKLQFLAEDTLKQREINENFITFQQSARDIESLRRRAESAEKIFADAVGYERPLQYGTAPAAALEQSSRAKLQKEFTAQSLKMLAPFFGGEETLNELFLDCIIVSLSKIFGKRWEINPRPGKKFFYSNWGELTLDGMSAGLIAWDFENLGCMISISGSGCVSTNMNRVYRLLTHSDMSIFKPKISRVDIALDDLAGEKINYEMMRDMCRESLFTPPRGAAPRYSCIESGHVVQGRFNRKTRKMEPHTKLDFMPDLGCSLYVGSRESGKMCRGYEKGIQLKCEEYPRWFRVEYELRAIDRILPPEILIKSDDFFCGCSAAAAQIFNDVTETQAEPVHILTFRAQVHAGREHVKKYAALQAARAVYLMREVEEMSDSQIVDFLVRRLEKRSEKDCVPRRLAVPVPFSLLPLRVDEPASRPSFETTEPTFYVYSLNDFYATVYQREVSHEQYTFRGHRFACLQNERYFKSRQSIFACAS